MRLRPVVVHVLAGILWAAPAGCKPIEGRGGAARPRVQLPEPLPLPAEPVAAAHLESPARALALAQPWVEPSVAPRAVLEQGLQQFTTPEVAARISNAIDPERPWASVRLTEGEELAHFFVAPGAMSVLREHLSGFGKEGRFGAVRLPERPDVVGDEPGPWSHKPHLAWLDEDAGTLTIATSLRGLVTGPEIAKAYGDDPIFVTVDRSMVPAVVPITRFTARGTLDDLEVVAKLSPDFDVGSKLRIETGALTGLLSGPGMVAGASTRVADHERAVKDAILEIDRVVEDQPFLMQGILQDLQAKLNTVLRSWDGRVMAALGPPGHLRVAYGADDPKNSGVAALRLLDTVVENVKLLRTFTDQVPAISIKKNVGEAAGEPIHQLTVGNAKSLLRKEFHALIDDANRLRVAMAWSRRAGAGMVVVGHEAVPNLERWLEASSRATSGEESRDDVLAAVVALDPEQAPSLRQRELAADVLLGLQARGPRREIVGRWIDAQTLKLELVGPPVRMRRDPTPSSP